MQWRPGLARDLKKLTTVESTNLFELIQRFGYYVEAGDQVTLISDHPDYKSYAYKYPHEYFAGPIKTLTKIINEVLILYRQNFNPTEEESKQLRLWLLGHVFAEAQNEILDCKNPKLVKQEKQEFQDSEEEESRWEFHSTTKPARHVLNFKKYILEKEGTPRDDGRLSKEQLRFMQTFFGDTMTEEDFDKIQLIIGRVHMSITVKNMTNLFLDNVKLCLAQFPEISRAHPLMNNPELTVHTNLNYDDENQTGLSLHDLVRDYGNVYSIKSILEKELGEAMIIVSTEHLINNLNELVVSVSMKNDDEMNECEILIRCKRGIKNALNSCFKAKGVETSVIDDVITVKQTRSNSSILNDYVFDCLLETDDSDKKSCFIIYLKNLLDTSIDFF